MALPLGGCRGAWPPAWVEHGRAPDQLLSAHVKLDHPGDFRELMARTTFPLEPGRIVFSRPVYPYPAIAKYSGRGNPADAVSFAPAKAGN